MRTLLCAVDLGDATRDVIRAAERWARSSGGRVVLVHVAAPDPDFVGLAVGPSSVRGSTADELRAEHRQLEDEADALRARGVECVALQIQGSAGDKIVEEAERVGADVIVVGSHGRGVLARALLGSVSQHVVTHSTRPVLVVPVTR